MRFFLSLRLLTLLFLTTAKAAIAQPSEDQPKIKIEDLTAPAPAPPPRRQPQSDNENQQLLNEQQLQNKRRQRKKKLRESVKQPQSDNVESSKKSEIDSRGEDLKPRPYAYLFELALVGGGALVAGDRSGYTLDPNVHMNAFWRTPQNQSLPALSPWFGLRIAPFVGTGYYKERPGNYGLTYFGPIFGWGRLAPPAISAAGEGRPAVGSDQDEDLPVLSGFAVTMGIAGVVYQGRRSFDLAGQKPDDDFQTKKRVQFDAPGAWAELRYLRVSSPAISTDWLLGLQSGRQKVFIYAGVGLGGWY